MQIFKVSRAPDDRIDYDEYDSFVCVAVDMAAARHMHPRPTRTWVDGTGWCWVGDTDHSHVTPDEYHSWTSEIDTLVIERIGVAIGDYPESGVVLTSFNAG